MRGKMITDKKLKESIKDDARKYGCDLDGDVVGFNGKYYYVNILEDKVYEMDYTPEGKSRMMSIYAEIGGYINECE